MELSSLTNQVSTQAAAQASALASLLLLRKTLELQAASIGGLVEAATPASASSNPPNLGNSVDVMI
ncbi:putative motility protein [Pseudomonas sp. NPDC079086]|uniref:putative motility protein n=1 Tax=unclassified Pseudomonas TaxID=196821 RepID=UPI0037C80FB9